MPQGINCFITTTILCLSAVFSIDEAKAQDSTDMTHLHCDSTQIAAFKIDLEVQPDSAATFPGGELEFYKLVASIKLKNNIPNNEGLYYVYLIIEANGEISHACFVAPENPYPMGNEIINKVVDSSPWIPATKNGVTVRSSCSFPIRYCIGR